MDYCSSCRRHLNGALVCPGCGAYAPDIAPPATAVPATAVPATAVRVTAVPAGGRIGSVSVPPEAVAAESVLVADVEEPSPAQQGRAARRRQLARWKKNKRRATVASAFALVGGGLTFAAMDRHSTDRAQAATVPDQRGMGEAEGRAAEQKPPESSPSTAQRAPGGSHASSRAESQPESAGDPRQRSLAAPPRTSAGAGQGVAAAPRPDASSVPEPRSAAQSAADTAPERSGTTAERPGTTTERQQAAERDQTTEQERTVEQPSAPATSDGADQGASRTVPALISTSPTEVCVLGVCLG